MNITIIMIININIIVMIIVIIIIIIIIIIAASIIIITRAYLPHTQGRYQAKRFRKAPGIRYDTLEHSARQYSTISNDTK